MFIGIPNLMAGQLLQKAVAAQNVQHAHPGPFVALLILDFEDTCPKLSCASWSVKSLPCPPASLHGTDDDNTTSGLSYN